MVQMSKLSRPQSVATFCDHPSSDLPRTTVKLSDGGPSLALPGCKDCHLALRRLLTCLRQQPTRPPTALTLKRMPRVPSDATKCVLATYPSSHVITVLRPSTSAYIADGASPMVMSVCYASATAQACRARRNLDARRQVASHRIGLLLVPPCATSTWPVAVVASCGESTEAT